MSEEEARSFVYESEGDVCARRQGHECHEKEVPDEQSLTFGKWNQTRTPCAKKRETEMETETEMEKTPSVWKRVFHDLPARESRGRNFDSA
mmetsp:Transcript_42766/g.110266  ORF Transcript_42766/g.110266 Transcript_42766/m.110266 type:complete len:91 (+) Transcript_42766:1262-1534(+)